MGSTGQLHHIEINVSDLHRSLAFWGWFLTALGYELQQQWSAGASYQMDDTYLVFVQTDTKYRTTTFHRRHTGLNHLAFHADSPSTVDGFRQRLLRRGVPLLYDDRYPRAGGGDSYAVFFEDPD